MNRYIDQVAGTVRTGAALGACLMVALYVHEAGEIELTAHETVRLDRATYSEADGFVAERYGDLLAPGTNRLRLEEGVYHFRTVGDARLRLDPRGSIEVTTRSQEDDKDEWPDPPPKITAQGGDRWAGHATAFVGKGIGGAGQTPTLTVLHDLDQG